MKITRVLAAAAAGTVLTLVSAPSAFAYNEPDFNPGGGSGADGEVAPGADFTISGDYGGTECLEGSFAEFEGDTQDASGTEFSFTFTAPDEDGEYPLTVTCVYDDGTDEPALGSAPVEVEAAAIVEDTFVFPIQVGAGSGGSGADGSGALPDTGAPTSQLLLVGAGLVAVGAAVTVADRRRRNNAA